MRISDWSSDVCSSDLQKRWAVALSEIVDNAAAPPRPDTLLWYRLACALPPELPQSSLATADPATASQARADYRFVLRSLGPSAPSHSHLQRRRTGRRRPPPPPGPPLRFSLDRKRLVSGKRLLVRVIL